MRLVAYDIAATQQPTTQPASQSLSRILKNALFNHIRRNKTL